jgi:hypothetical protein
MLHAVFAEVRAWPPQDGVEHQPALVESEILHRRADQAPHERTRAIAPDDITCSAVYQAAG